MKKNIFTKDNLMFFIILNLGLIFTAVGIAIFKTPNHFAFGGTSGLSIILSTLFPTFCCRFFSCFCHFKTNLRFP